MESPKGNQLTDHETVQLEELREDITTLLSEASVDGDNDEEADRKTSARDRIVGKIVDPDFKDIATQEIIDSHNRYIDESDSQTGKSHKQTAALYAYWALIEKARQYETRSNIPEEFLAFVQELADEEGETGISFKLLLTGSGIEDAVHENRFENTSYYAILGQLESMSAEKRRQLELSRTYHLGVLNDVDSNVPATDKTRLEKRKDDPDGLLKDINKGRFKTQEGMNAAEAQQDLDRLATREGDLDGLLIDIGKGRFETPEGMSAAKAQQDLDRLAAREGDPDGLFEDIDKGYFTTLEGRDASRAQHDLDRLAEREGDPDGLLKDIDRGLFTTREGRDASRMQQDLDRLAAREGDPDGLLIDIGKGRFKTPEVRDTSKTQHDSDRLAARKGDINGLHDDLTHGRFLTKEGKAEAERIIKATN